MDPDDPDEPEAEDGSDAADESDEEGEVGEAEVPAFVLSLMAAGLISADLTVAELAATGGPDYELDELSVEVVISLCDQLDAAGVHWGIDRTGSLIVHRNHERRADAVLETVFGPDDLPDDDPESVELREELEAMAGRLGAAPGVDESGGAGSPVETRRRTPLTLVLVAVMVIVLVVVML
jgi:hypothetical protein